MPTKSYKAISRFKNSDMDAVMDNGPQFPRQPHTQKKRRGDGDVRTRFSLSMSLLAAYLACNLLKDGGRLELMRCERSFQRKRGMS